MVIIAISWYNNSVKKRGDIQKGIKKDLTSIASNLKSKIILKNVYILNIENGGKPQKIYIRPYYNLIGAKKKMEIYELKPITSQKSFYGKAIVKVDDNGDETLYSYNTPIIKKLVDGTYKKLWDGWTAATGKHIKSFCGLSKAEFMGLE